MDDWVVTPRRGKPVEINAPWYQAVCLLDEWAAVEGFAVGGTVPPSAGEGREVVSTTVVQIANDAGRTVTINSWRTRAPDEAL